jgi:hypothetical protein
MTDSDVLVRAAKALREAHDGRREGSGFTRARVMSTLHRERRRTILRWAIASPLASVLLVGSAWAQSTGQWPAIWQAVTRVFVAAPRQPEPVHSRRHEPAPRQVSGASALERRSEPSDAAAPEAIAPAPAPLPEVAPPEPPGLERSQPLPPKPLRPRSKRRAPGPKSMPSSASTDEGQATTREDGAARAGAPERAPDGELSRFRAAHDLHFMGDRPRDAIAAYERYLREFPSGRFVPEASYNIALDRIKLGDKAGARAALAPFADGRYGSYRQKEAAQLLDALR